MLTQHRTLSRILRQPWLWECLVWFVISAGWIWLFSQGDENGVGYFHRPEQSLTIPLIVGGIINATLFIANAFYAVPKFLETGRWRQYALCFITLFIANVVSQTGAQQLIILFWEPSLKTIMTTSLLIENTYLAFSILILSSLYKFTRDWVRHQYERRTYQDETESLRQALQQTRHEMHVLSSAGNPSSFLQINSGNEKLQIPTSTILYIKSAGNYADIFTPNQSYLAYGAMKDFIEKLPQKRFSRIHRSYIVGMEHIHMIKGSAIYLNDVKLPLGASYKKSFFQKWNERSQTEVDKPKSI